MIDNRMKPAQRHGIWLVWDCWLEWRWHPAITDDFGNLVMINASSAHHSLLS